MNDFSSCSTFPKNLGLERHRRIMNTVRAQTCRPSVNSTGDIVTLENTEYRWRDGSVYKRVGEGESLWVEWKTVPQCVRALFTEQLEPDCACYK